MRALRLLGAEATALVRSPEVPAALQVPFIACPKPSTPEVLRRFVLETCTKLRADTLVLDTFPEGLLGELRGAWNGPRRVSLLRCRRDCRSDTFRHAVEALEAAADLEPHLGWRPPSVLAEELGPVTRFGTEADPGPSPIDVLLVASDVELAGFLGRLGERLRAHGLCVGTVSEGILRGPAIEASGFPLPARVLATRVIVGPAGFNLTYEAQVLGAWHVALPRPRSHDDQHLRASVVARTVGSPEAAERLCVQLSSITDRAPRRAPIKTSESVAQWILG